MSNDIAKNFGLDDLEVLDPISSNNEVSTIVEKVPSTEVDGDFQTARENFLSIIKNTGDAVTDLIEIAKQSQNWKDYDALAKLLNTSIIANRELIEAHKTFGMIHKNLNREGKNVTNNMFVGTTADLLALMEKYKK